MILKAPKEADLIQPCLTLLQLAGIFAWRSNNSGVKRTDKKGREFWSFRGLKGVADLLGVTLDGRLVAVELKNPTGDGELSEHQAHFLSEVNRRGGLGVVVSSVVALEEYLRKEGLWT